MNKYIYRSWQLSIAVSISIITSSCKKFFDVPVDRTLVENETVYKTDENAIAAMNGIYQTMVQGSFAGGGSNGITALTGLSADEFHNVLKTPAYNVFEENELVANDDLVLGLWTNAYKIIYQTNDVLEELDRSTSISVLVKNRLKGEALFARSFCYFYLVNLFGDVPLVLTSNYLENSIVKRRPFEEVYTQIISDLEVAKNLLPAEYIKFQRTKPNRLSASALLARCYLYTQQWEAAEMASTEVISSPNYNLEIDLNNVFKIESGETIWQLASEQGRNTFENFLMISSYLATTSMELSGYLQDAFEDGDERKSKWTKEVSDLGSGIELISWYKYKAELYSSPTSEYFVVLRLAEQLLIRAEARANLQKNLQAISDINAVRNRATLPLIDETSPMETEEILSMIYQEKRIEFFGEWGHRWFDLKRIDNVTNVIGSIKATWSSNDALYPIPAEEFQKNPALGNQNTGY